MSGRQHVRWPADVVLAWADERPTPVGCNFIPSTAINQIEMWAAATFDRATIARELAWAAGLGFNSVRTYLHDESWRVDRTGFLERVDAFIDECARHGIAPLLVIFDDCWHEPVPGDQPAPRPGVHNSGWARSPGAARLADRSGWTELEQYVRDVLRAFGDDPRVLGWDIYNEVTNFYLPSLSLPDAEREHALTTIRDAKPGIDQPSIDLMEAAFVWARDEGAVQPLTAGEYRRTDDRLNDRVAELSDVVSFHNYRDVQNLTDQIARLEGHGRPLWCTEYLNRRVGCTFETHLPVLLAHRIGAWNWGLVDGKTQTKWAWSDPAGSPPPSIWFHDVLNADGSSYDPAETEFIRSTLVGATSQRDET
jgi:hypothetical protein